MAQFDVYRTSSGDLLLDCQSDFLSHYNSRVVVPLLAPTDELPIMKRLNPVFAIAKEERVMMTEFATAVPLRDLGVPVTSLAEHDLTIKAALDMLISGF
jgi:toxin CcdB